MAALKVSPYIDIMLFFYILWSFSTLIWERSSAQPGARRREGCRIYHYLSWTDTIKPSLLFSKFGCCISKGSVFRLFVLEISITSVWQVYRDPIGNSHTGAVQKCAMSAAGADLLSGALSLGCFLFSKTPFTYNFTVKVARPFTIMSNGHQRTLK